MSRLLSGRDGLFARTGNPSHPGIPEWPPYDVERRATRILDAECRVAFDHFREERVLWDSLAGA